MRNSVTLEINGQQVRVRSGTSVAAAILTHGGFRRSVSGQRRSPICGMGTCFECRATVDGVSHVRTCQMLCCEGMRVRTDA
jgi:sarcosine oxidase subunit alpha